VLGLGDNDGPGPFSWSDVVGMILALAVIVSAAWMLHR